MSHSQIPTVASAAPAAPAEHPIGDEYRAIAAGEHADGPRGRLLLAVSTDDVAEGKGDLFVALGLGRALVADGWGVALWPIARWAEPVPEDTGAVVVMIESFVPGLVPAGTAVIAWVRNWTAQWASLPYLDEFDAIWTSSGIARDAVAAVYDGVTDVVPIAADLDLFTKDASADTAGRADRAVTTVNFWGARRRVQDVLEQVDPPEPILWYAANTEHLTVSPGVELRPMVSFFSLPEVYRSAAFVVDDVIAPAAEYGTLNSRLYESLACGALPLTDCALGLDELGLGDVPVFGDADELATLLAMPADERTALVERLHAVVVERHSYAARAAQVGPGIEAALARAATRSGTRSPLLAWAARQREEFRATAAEKDLHRSGVEDINERLIAAHAHILEVDDARIRAESERDRIAAQYAALTSSAAFRVARRLVRAARGVRGRRS